MRFTIIALVFSFMLFAPTASEATVSEGKSIDEIFNKLQSNMMCLCGGCNSTLKQCPHANCGFAIPARKEMRAMLEQGKHPDEVITYFVKANGERILAAPTKKGFNLVGYITPFLAILVVGSLVAKTVSRWASKGSAESESFKHGQSPVAVYDDELKERMKKELDDFDD
ncbi:hypothetical protein MNBD_NITROSPINAE02-16 [hydrothermal vent metagenome]|uniref:CcmH/CycL/Ccl2/NrfF N-terminal domain-containing protein n=1 Tax=hydrothermal vent metagenome TaxID=652676 RepID=A0A3B1CSQ9_9ZZZZ